MKVSVIGTGYVGLVTGTCLAETGNDVICVDIDENKVNRLKDGIIPIYEKGLEPLVKSNYEAKRLNFTTNFAMAVDKSDIIIIAVGTPPNEDGSADLKHVLGVAKTIGQKMKSHKLIVTKSTVPVGTGDKVREAIENELRTRGEQIKFSIASNPEFLKEGSAVADFMKPDRILIGCDDDKAEQMLRELYGSFVLNGHRFIKMDIRSAELCKYASNAMLATKISFMNELSRIAETVGADIIQVRQGMGADKRIGYDFTHAGLGYGGSCFPKDVNALMNVAKSIGLEAPLLKAVEAVNDTQRIRFIETMKEAMGTFKGKKVAVWGLAFKPDTDDIRKAPSIDIIEALLEGGAGVVCYDPVAADAVAEHFKNNKSVAFAEDMYEALADVDAMVLCTEWKFFRSPDFEKMRGLMKTPLIFDGRNQYDPTNLKEKGFKYYCVGRTPVT